MTAPTTPSVGTNNEQQGLSLPQMLAKAMALSAGLNGQAETLAADLQAKVGHLLPPPISPSAAADAVLDLPKVIERLQAELKHGVEQLGVLASSLGVTVPAGAGMDSIMAALAAATVTRGNQHLAAMGLPVEPAAPAPTALPDLGEVVKRSQEAVIKAQKEADAMFVSMGLDPAAPEAGLARLMPQSAPAAQMPMAGFPGADALAAMQQDAQRLGQMTNELFAKIIPR